MSEASPVRVYINGRGIDAPSGAPVLDAVCAWDATVAQDIAEGRRALADSRGLPLDPATAVYGGLIMRVVSNRAGRSEPGA